jgi:intracellular septation protein A
MSEPNDRARILPVLFHVAENMAPLIAFVALSRLVSLKAAIAGAIAIALLDGIRRFVFKIPYNRLALLAAIMTVGFGLVDLFSRTPFMLHYEGVITNFLIGVAFAYSALGRKSLIQVLAEKRRKSAFTDRPDLRRFFEILTFAWAGYFFLKSGLYLYLGLTLPLERAVELRALWGTVSLGVMIGLTVLLGRPLFRALARHGMLPGESGPSREARSAK